MTVAWTAFNDRYYDAAVVAYLDALEARPRDPTALAGLAWSYSYLGKDDLALEYAEQALAVDPGNASAQDLRRRIREAEWRFSHSSYVGYLRYSSALKNHAYTGGIASSATHRGRHGFDIGLTGFMLTYEPLGIPDLDENTFSLGYRYTGDWSASALIQHVTTDDVVIGDGNIFHMRVGTGPFFGSFAISDFDQTSAMQGGVGYVWHPTEKYSLTTRVEILHRDEIPGFALSKTYKVLAQHHRVDFGRWVFDGKYTVGRHSLFLSEDGYVSYNAPDELSALGSGAVSYRLRDDQWVGYELGYARGRHFDPSGGTTDFSVMGHILKYSWNY